MNQLLTDLGFPSDHYPSDQTLTPGRISAQAHGQFRVLTAQGQILARLSGNDTKALVHTLDYPVTGDHVLVDPDGLIREILPRRTLLTRGDHYSGTLEEALAANVDLVLVVISMNQDFNIRKIRRFLIMAQSSGASPILVLTKADLPTAEESHHYLETARSITDCPILATRQDAPETIAPLGELLQGKTAVLLGASGAGKSTLINRLVGSDLMKTAGIRAADDQGRHTTTHREIIVIPGVGCLIDTPGLRKVELLDDGSAVDGVYDQIRQLSGQCRYRDCSHGSEPDCAIRSALASGSLSMADWLDYQAMQQEARLMEAKARQREKDRIRQNERLQQARPRKKTWRELDW